MNINIICIGKIKDKYILDGIQEFAKRLQAFGKLKVIELKEDGNDSNRNISIEKESKAILETLDKNKGFKILLDISGKNYSSEEMANHIEKIGVN
ncbi:MAG: 23S rRNA (pseudouridine(1915)-N(3))-methyltransferase RlmH, partial [Cetobacterium sp.]